MHVANLDEGMARRRGDQGVHELGLSLLVRRGLGLNLLVRPDGQLDAGKRHRLLGLVCRVGSRCRCGRGCRRSRLLLLGDGTRVHVCGGVPVGRGACARE